MLLAGIGLLFGQPGDRQASEMRAAEDAADISRALTLRRLEAARAVETDGALAVSTYSQAFRAAAIKGDWAAVCRYDDLARMAADYLPARETGRLGSFIDWLEAELA